MNKPEQSLEEYVSGLPENEFRCWWELHGGEAFKEFAVQVLENGERWTSGRESTAARRRR